MCKEIRHTLVRVISEVTQELRYTPNQPVVAFLCNHQHNPAMSLHAAKEGGYLLCTKDNMIITEVTDNERLWLQGLFNISCIVRNTVFPRIVSAESILFRSCQLRLLNEGGY